MTEAAATTAFITRWQAATGSERANHQLFLTELCALLGVPQPEPASDDTRDNAYVFERRVQFMPGSVEGAVKKAVKESVKGSVKEMRACGY